MSGDPVEVRRGSDAPRFESGGGWTVGLPFYHNSVQRVHFADGTEGEAYSKALVFLIWFVIGVFIYWYMVRRRGANAQAVAARPTGVGS